MKNITLKLQLIDFKNQASFYSTCKVGLIWGLANNFHFFLSVTLPINTSESLGTTGKAKNFFRTFACHLKIF